MAAPPPSPDKIGNFLSQAEECLRSGVIAGADILTRRVLAHDAENPRARDLLERIEAQILPRPMTGPSDTARYLVARAWGAGLWSDLSQLLGVFLLAEMTGRIPVVYWGAESHYNDDPSHDLYGTLFHPPSETRLNDLLALEDDSVFPSKWKGRLAEPDSVGKWKGPESRIPAIAFLARQETVAVFDYFTSIAELAPWIPSGHALAGLAVADLYRHLAEKYLRPRPEIAERVSRFKSARLPGPYAAIHMRGGDKNREVEDLEAINRYFAEIVEQALGMNDLPIFVMTDDARRLDELRVRYGLRIVATECTRVDSDVGIHLVPGANKRGLAVEMLTDTYVALGADAFIGNGYSNASAIVAAIKDWPPRSCWLVGKSLLLAPNLEIHTGSVA